MARSHRLVAAPAPAVAAALAALVAVLLAAGACTSDVDTPPPRAAAVGCDPALAAWAERGFSGAVAVLRAGAIECLAGYGEADRASGAANTGDTVFRIGSVTKAVTAAAVLDLADQGRLSLGDRAGDLVPGLGGPAVAATVEQLLDHRSGLTGAHAPADDQPMDHDQAVAAISGLGAAFEPGTDETYSDAGYTLLALVVEARAGTTYRDQLASETLRLPGGERAGGFWDGEPAAPGPRAVGYVGGHPADGPGPVEGGHWALDGARRSATCAWRSPAGHWPACCGRPGSWSSGTRGRGSTCCRSEHAPTGYCWAPTRRWRWPGRLRPAVPARRARWTWCWAASRCRPRRGRGGRWRRPCWRRWPGGCRASG